ncbi:MAG: ABC transporter permease [Bacteroidales bacterium]|nr:ABC transporter permease [Bacteroidales bacterium]
MIPLPLRFAFRYLFARKSYNVINLISGIGVAGMAVGTAALITVLSVFNGFNALVSDSLAQAGATLVVRPAGGKVFIPEGPAFDWLSQHASSVSQVLEEQAFLSFEDRQSLARVKGIDSVSESGSALEEHIVSGRWQLHRGDLPQAVGGAALSHNLGIRPQFVTPLEIHYPSRTGSISLANPAASLETQRVQLAGTFSINAELDAKLIIVPIEVMRELLDYDKEVSALEIECDPALKKELQERLGPDFRVLDLKEQNESVYRMMRYEKLAIYLILVFIVALVAFNIYSSLRMLIIEKEADMGTLRSLGAPEALLRRIFLLEGVLVSLLGMAIGLLIGITAVILQQRFGFVPMPGNFAVTSYPVALKATDILYTVLGVSFVGLVMAFIPSRKLN